MLGSAEIVSRTGIGKIFAMLTAAGLIYVDYHMWGRGGWFFLTFDYFIFHFFLLCITAAAVSNKEKKWGRAILLVVVLIFIVFLSANKNQMSRVKRHLENLPAQLKHDIARSEANNARWKEHVRREAELRQKARETMNELCTKSGEFIYRKAENVNGILLLRNEANLYPDDGLWYKPNGYRHIDNIVILRAERIGLWNRHMGRRNYRRIGELATYDIKFGGGEHWNKDPNYRRYIRDLIENYQPDLGRPLYAVTGHDISEKDGIKGRSLRVIDLQTEEVMAEQISYVYRNAFGCPFPIRKNALEGIKFVQKVLKPAP
jgi:hypothetical protein